MYNIYLDIPYGERHEAKKFGVKWDPQHKKWYTSSLSKNTDELVKRWPEKAKLNGITGELPRPDPLILRPQPSPVTKPTLRESMSPVDWDRIKNFVKDRAGGACEYCGAGGTLYIHDLYDYDTTRKYRKLTRLLSVCKGCREALASCGYPARDGLTDLAIMQLQRLRQISAETAMNEYASARGALVGPIHLQGVSWTTDLSILTNSGIMI